MKQEEFNQMMWGILVLMLFLLWFYSITEITKPDPFADPEAMTSWDDPTYHDGYYR